MSNSTQRDVRINMFGEPVKQEHEDADCLARPTAELHSSRFLVLVLTVPL